MFTCTFCEKELTKDAAEPCKACERELLAYDSPRPRKQVSRNCRHCNETLPVSRYFHCETCVPADTREAEDSVWEQVETWEQGEVAYTPPRVGDKTCKSCNKVKSKTAFGAHNGYSDGLQAKCRLCLSAYRRERKARMEGSAHHAV